MVAPSISFKVTWRSRGKVSDFCAGGRGSILSPGIDLSDYQTLPSPLTRHLRSLQLQKELEYLHHLEEKEKEQMRQRSRTLLQERKKEEVLRYREEKWTKEQSALLARQRRELREVEERAARANVLIKVYSGVLRHLSNLGEVGLNSSENRLKCRLETGDWSGLKPTSLEQGLANYFPTGEQDEVYVARQRFLKEHKESERLKQRTSSSQVEHHNGSVQAKRDPERLLQATEVWKERCKKQNTAANQVSRPLLHLRNMPRL
uniref:(California timema) hypothetical protein n=1 Tax=Timema californicum TaxID=61474 RepID=A0A7R9P5X8_TIMCA|nr:unnamed protein product [Timema californicum]